MALEYSAFCSQVFDAARCDMITGCEATITKKLSTWTLVHSLALRPRVYPSEFHKQAGEDLLPGSIQAIISTEFSGMPFSFTLSRGSPPSVQLTVPLSDQASVGGVAQISSDFPISVNTKLLTRKFTTNWTLNTFNKLTGASIEADAVYMPSESVGLGGYLVRPLGSGITTASISTMFRIGQNSISTVLYQAEKATAAIAVARILKTNTVAGTSLELRSDGDSECRFGFQRGFMMSRLAVSCSTKGIVQSFYQRQLKGDVLVSVSAYLDLKHDVNSLGIGVTLND